MRALVVFFVLLSTAAHAVAASPPAATPPGLLCRAAIASAERIQAIPAHLLAAIGRVESGRRDETTGAAHPWPWTINAEGQGQFFDSQTQAVAAVRALQARGVRSIDVGCMQVNLMHHPNAFATLEQAFDPPANAAYAARFLRQLFEQSGNWTKAAGLYHSATPELSEPYAKEVLAMLEAESKLPPAPTALAQSWAATVPHGALPPARQVANFPPAGGLGIGRGLDLYRAQPVGMAPRPAHTVSRF